MELKPGAVWHSQISDTQVIVVRAPVVEVELTCGGVPMSTEAGGTRAEVDGELLIGKRYVNAEAGLEVLCTKPGAGILACDGRPLEMAQPKPLPSSD